MIRKGFQPSTVFLLFSQGFCIFNKIHVDIEQSLLTPCQGLIMGVDPQAQLLLNLLVGNLHGFGLKSWTKEL
jgi:hypothetical protein